MCMFHRHRYDLYKTDDYMDRIVFKFQCLECGHLRTEITEKGSGYKIEVD